MGQRFALVAVEKNDVPRLGLLFAQLQAQAHAFHLAFRLTSFQRVPRPPPTARNVAFTIRFGLRFASGPFAST